MLIGGRQSTANRVTANRVTADRLLGGLVVLKAVDVAVRGPQALPGPLWVVVLAGWVAAGLALVSARPELVRGAWAAVVVTGVALAVDLPLELRRQHLVLLIGVALAAVVARDVPERLLLWRVQLLALYGVAALAKLNESFLGGDVLALTVATGPLGGLGPPPTAVLVVAGAVLVTVEAALAVLLWVSRWRRAMTVGAAALHTGALLVAGASPMVALRLVVFGGAAVVLCAACAGLLSPSSRRVGSGGGAGSGGAGRAVAQVHDDPGR